MGVRTQKAVQAERTRKKLLRAARRLFADHGYADTSAEDIAERAGVTRGTLYYHFRDKRELFQSLCEELESECTERITRAVLSAGPVEAQARQATRAALDAFLEPTYSRVVVREGPVALGWAAWHEIMSRFSRQQLRLLMQVAMDQGLIRKHPPEALAAVVVGAVNEAGIAISAATHPKRTRDEFEEVISAMLDALLFGRAG